MAGEDKPAHQGRGKEFRRHRVIDKPAHQPGVRQQEHRPRYSYKERPEPLEHNPPSICKPYKWKPYTKEQEARWRASMEEAKKNAEQKQEQLEARRKRREKKEKCKPGPQVENMDKKQLVEAMAWEHPLVSLQVGTVAGNSKRAAATAPVVDQHGQPVQQQQQQQLQQQAEVKSCLQGTTDQVRVTKRHAQEFLGSYIETAFKCRVMAEDRSIFSNLCPAVQSKIHEDSNASSSSSSSNSSTEAGDDGEDDDDDEQDGEDEENSEDDADKEPSAVDKPFIAFYQILLSHIYSRKKTGTTVAGRQVDQLLTHAAAIGITLPPIQQHTTLYSTNYLLGSTSR